MASLLALFLGLGLATAEEIHLVRRSKQPRSGGEVASLNMITSASTAPFGETKISTSDNGAAADFTPRDHAAAVGFAPLGAAGKRKESQHFWRGPGC